MRWLEVDGRECIRLVGLVVRDRAWRTLPPLNLRERARVSGGGVIDGETAVEDATLDWRLEFSPRPMGIEVRAIMTARKDVITNRAGLVVLLPAESFNGAPFTLRHGDGRKETGRMPDAIAAHQPMLDVRDLQVQVRGGPGLALAFEGDTYEMEDQRNWLDPSFKLYNRPLTKPFPYRIPDGEEVEHRVVIDLSGAPRPVRRPRTPATARRGTMPAIGIATAPGRVPRTAEVIALVQGIRPAFIVHRTDARARGVEAAARFARLLAADLRIESFGDGVTLANAISAAKPQSVVRYFPGPHIDAALACSRAQIAGGTFADFVMLNRNGISDAADRATFALCPTVHARDDRSLIESLDAVSQVFTQGRHLAGTRPLDAGPCSLRRRLVPATGKPAVEGPGRNGQDYDIDPRQHDNIAAAWLACTIAIGAITGVSSLCTFEPEGARGLVYEAPGLRARRRQRYRRSSAYAVLDALAELQATEITVHAIDALRGGAFVVHGKSTELWLVELRGRSRSLPTKACALGSICHCVSGPSGARWSLMTTARRIARFGIARIAVIRARTRDITDAAYAWVRDESRP